MQLVWRRGLPRPFGFARCLFCNHLRDARPRARITERIIQISRLAERGVDYQIAIWPSHDTGAEAEDELAKSTSEVSHERRRGQAVLAASAVLCRARSLSL